jgi:hypothetical protein
LAIEEITGYQAVCDCCRTRITDSAAWHERWLAEFDVTDSGGTMSADLVLCGSCHSEYLDGLDEEAAEALALDDVAAWEQLRVWVGTRRQERQRLLELFGRIRREGAAAT